MRVPPWLLLAMIVVTGVYVMPSVVAKFAGSHTMEANKTASAAGMECGNCHTWITDELDATSVATPVLNAHIFARGDPDYANLTTGEGGVELNIPKNTSTTTKQNVCPLCHQAQTSVSGTHTRVVTRVCTDPACHGDSQVYGANGSYPNAGAVGINLSNANDSHSAWFSGLEGYNSSRPIEFATAAKSGYDYDDMKLITGSTNYTAGYYACLGCHTHTGLLFTLVRPNVINMSMTYSSESGWSVTQAVTNTTNTSTVIVERGAGTVWIQ